MSKVKKFATVFSLVILLVLGSLGLVACCGDPGETPISIDVSSTLKADAENVLEIMQDNVLDKLTKVDEGNTNNQGHYTVEEAMEEVPEFTNYYILVGTVSNAEDLTSVGFGTVIYEKDETIPLSVGNNKFIEDRVYYFENDKLYMAAPVVLVESAGQDVIKLNGQAVAFNAVSAVETINFSNVAFCFDTTNSVSFEDGKYTLTYNEAGSKSMVGFYYDGMAQNDLSVNRLYKNGELNSYSLTYNTDADKSGNYPLTYYFVSYSASGDVNEISESFDGAEYELTAYIQGKGVATATVINNINYTEAEA